MTYCFIFMLLFRYLGVVKFLFQLRLSLPNFQHFLVEIFRTLTTQLLLLGFGIELGKLMLQSIRFQSDRLNIFEPDFLGFPLLAD